MVRLPVSDNYIIEKIEKEDNKYIVYFSYGWFEQLFNMKQEIRRFKLHSYTIYAGESYGNYCDEYGNYYRYKHSVCKELDKYERSLNF